MFFPMRRRAPQGIRNVFRNNQKIIAILHQIINSIAEGNKKPDFLGSSTEEPSILGSRRSYSIIEFIQNASLKFERDHQSHQIRPHTSLTHGKALFFAAGPHQVAAPPPPCPAEPKSATLPGWPFKTRKTQNAPTARHHNATLKHHPWRQTPKIHPKNKLASRTLKFNYR